jgi:asparagine synthase (glutamine-hydrolysing)
MCGITGWLATPESTVDCNVLATMRDSLAHRGPDGAGIWLGPDRRTGLAFRRLAIVDLADNANQPMANEDGSVHIVFNGEIYNHAALRRELLARGHRFRTDHSDTESILHGYEEWGDDVVERLHGMFAIGIWDERRRRLFLARDRVGIKPLYFTWGQGDFLFASEIKALLVNPAVKPALERAALYHYLSFLTTPAPLTMFRGIYKMPAGHRASIEADGAFHIERYWDALPPGGVNSSASEGELMSRTRGLLDRAVEKRLMSDVPFGVFLSGGVDSSAIVALMSRHLDQPVKTFTVGFSDHERLNELTYARRVAGLFETDHHEVLVDEKAMHEYLPTLVYSQDEPIADWVCIPLYFVSRLVRGSGTIVVQVGEGSDEQFCGYDSYMGYLRLHRRYWAPFRKLLPQPARSAVAALARWGAAATGRGGFYSEIIDRVASGREHFWGGAMAYWESAKRRLIDEGRWPDETPNIPRGLQSALPASFFLRDTFNVVREYLGRFDSRMPSADVLARMIYLEFKVRLPELLLMRVDKITMSTSVEARVPFLDHELVEFTMGVPMAAKIRNGVPKYLLKKSLEGLIPEDIIYRKKMGFGAPMREWLAGDFGHAAESTIMRSRLREERLFDYDHVADMFRRHRAGHDHSLPIWTIYNLTAWFDRWIAADAREWV